MRGRRNLRVGLHRRGEQGGLLVAECSAECADHRDNCHAKACIRVVAELDRLEKVRVLLEDATDFLRARLVIVDGQVGEFLGEVNLCFLGDLRVVPDVEDVAVLVDRHVDAPAEETGDALDMVAAAANLAKMLPLATVSAGLQDQEFGFHSADADGIACDEVVE